MIYFKTFLSIIIVALALFKTGSATEIHKWVDENGAIHFQQSPPENIKQPVIIKRLPTYQDNFRDNENTASKQPSDNNSSNNPTNTRETYSEADVKLYVTSWCPYCKKASEFFRSRGIPFTEFDIEKDKRAARRKKRLTKENGVPFVIINGQPIHGFKRSAYERALNEG
jgi:glutaredoxin